MNCIILRVTQRQLQVESRSSSSRYTALPSVNLGIIAEEQSIEPRLGSYPPPLFLSSLCIQVVVQCVFILPPYLFAIPYDGLTTSLFCAFRLAPVFTDMGLGSFILFDSTPWLESTVGVTPPCVGVDPRNAQYIIKCTGAILCNDPDMAMTKSNYF